MTKTEQFLLSIIKIGVEHFPSSTVTLTTVYDEVKHDVGRSGYENAIRALIRAGKIRVKDTFILEVVTNG